MINGEHADGSKWLTTIEVIIIAPVFVLMGAAVVVALSTSIMMALIVIGFAVAILFVGTAATRQVPAKDISA